MSFGESGHSGHGNLNLSQKLFLGSAPSEHRNLFLVSPCYPEEEVALHHHLSHLFLSSRMEAHPSSHYSPSCPTSLGRAEGPYLRENVSPTDPAEMHLLKSGVSLHVLTLTRASRRPGKSGGLGTKKWDADLAHLEALVYQVLIHS